MHAGWIARLRAPNSPSTQIASRRGRRAISRSVCCPTPWWTRGPSGRKRWGLCLTAAGLGPAPPACSTGVSTDWPRAQARPCRCCGLGTRDWMLARQRLLPEPSGILRLLLGLDDEEPVLGVVVVVLEVVLAQLAIHSHFLRQPERLAALLEGHGGVAHFRGFLPQAHL